LRERAKVQRYRIPRGNRGIRKTVRFMGRLAREALTDPLTVETAALIVNGSSEPGEMASRIREFLVEYVRFVPDPVGQELIRSPRFMLERVRSHGFASGDCDDVATLGAALGMCVGLPARFVLLSFSPLEPFSHVYAEIANGCCWTELDTTAPAQFPPGLQVFGTETHEVHIR